MNKQKVIAGEKLQKLDLVVKREDEKYYKVRSRQEIIREGLYRILLNKKHDVIQDLANSILSYLHSQKCRIEVDRELPELEYEEYMRLHADWANSKESIDNLLRRITKETRYKIAKSGCVAVLPLIEEGK